jgi:eukaryotic-like serine/threonine-protein kinase
MSYLPSDAKRLFLQAMELHDPQQRGGFLDRACRDNAQLRSRVEELLASAEDPGSFLQCAALEEVDSSAGERHLHSEHAATAIHGTSGADHPAVTVPLDFLEPCATPGRIGKLGAYEVIEVVGCGGMGIVLKAFDTKLQRVVAIKLLSPTLAHNATAVKRFLREARAAAAVSHDHVVTIFAVEETSSPPYLVMEFIGGQSLQQKIDRCGSCETPEILRIGMQIAEGLAAAHKQGLIHRDIKPANVLLENGVERVKITDFGLARAVDDVTMTQTGHVAGTPEYMSPEQAKGEQLDVRSDLFSLGSVLYTMCTGRPAFRAETTVAVLRRVCDDQPRPIAETQPAVPDALVTVIDRLLAKQPEQRFQSAQEVADVLSAQLAGRHHLETHRGPAQAAAPQGMGTPLLLGIAALIIVGVALFAAAGSVVLFKWRPWLGRDTNVVLSRVTPVAPPTIDAGSTVIRPVLPPLAIVPFDEQRAQTHQKTWADHMQVPVEYEDPLHIHFRLIPPGRFRMGRSADEVNLLLRQLELDKGDDYAKFRVQSSAPQHEVRLSQPFYLSAHEITVAQFRTFVDETGYRTTLESVKSPPFTWTTMLSFDKPDELPVMGVSWEDARAFCRWLSKRHRITYELPSEAQWEFACRAGSETRWSFGEDTIYLAEYAVCEQKDKSRPAPVGSKRPNAFGLYDMHGNADEWCFDWHMRDFYARSPQDDPVYTQTPLDPGSGRVVRGGAWNSTAWATQSASRSYDFPGLPVGWHGFRIAIVGPLFGIHLPSAAEIESP